MRDQIICVVTSSRADYGLLAPLMGAINRAKGLKLSVVAAGMHFDESLGNTYLEIEKDGFTIDEKIDFLMTSRTEVGMCKSLGLFQISLCDAFSRIRPDMVIILGDRYEMLAVAATTLFMGIPLSHIHGGEITEGAIDDPIRHALTKMSDLHFPSHEVYRKRILQLGENPECVFNVGSLGAENIRNLPYLDADQLKEELGIPRGKKIGLVTFHPETTTRLSGDLQVKPMLESIRENPDLFYVFTKANADAEGEIINREIEAFLKENPHLGVCYASLGRIRYLSLMKIASLVLGNSSSGVIEAPVLNIPVVNIGSRQKGRIRFNNVIDCSNDLMSISQSIKEALSRKFIEDIYNTTDIDSGEACSVSESMAQIIYCELKEKRLNKSKKFCDII